MPIAHFQMNDILRFHSIRWCSFNGIIVQSSGSRSGTMDGEVEVDSFHFFSRTRIPAQVADGSHIGGLCLSQGLGSVPLR